MDAIRLCPYCLRPAPIPASACPHCAHRFAGVNPAGSLPVGTVLAGRYTIGELIRIDGEGILYQGAENHGAFRVTVKEYLPLTLSAERTDGLTLRPKPGSEVLFKTTRMDFADLYRSIQRITPANGLEAVLDVVEANNTVYAVMESPGGRPLQKWLEEHPGPVDPAQAREMLRPVFDGVVAMHRVGLVHRGICPENIRVLDNGRARLAGYATVGLRTAGSGLHEQLYEGYSAPEQYSTAEFEGRYTDEYSLAAVFYRMVCGQSPVPAAQRAVSDSNPRAKTLEPSVPVYVSEALQMGLRLKPAERIQTVPLLMEALSSPEKTDELARSLRSIPEEGEAGAKTGRGRRPSVQTILTSILLLLAVLTALTIRRKGEKDRIGKWPCFVWLGFLAVIAAGVIYVLYDANVAGNAEKYAAISKYVVFNDAWGTNRGYAWIRSMEVFKEFFTTKDKIFGYGPETFRVLMENYYLGELGNVIFDNAHNEYLHYLITIGLFGMLSYMAWLGTSIFWMARNLKDRPEVAACLFALAAYAVQATVNLNLPVAMPVTVQLLAMGVSRQLKKKENESI